MFTLKQIFKHTLGTSILSVIIDLFALLGTNNLCMKHQILVRMCAQLNVHLVVGLKSVIFFHGCSLKFSEIINVYYRFDIFL